MEKFIKCVRISSNYYGFTNARLVGNWLISNMVLIENTDEYVINNSD